MNNLIKNELIKILKSKTIYILIIFSIILIAVCTYFTSKNEHYIYDNSSYYVYMLEELENEISTYITDSQKATTKYVEILSSIEQLELESKYSYESWEYNMIVNNIVPLIIEKNTYLYIENDYQKSKEIENEISDMINKITQNKWKEFLEEDLEHKKEELQISLNDEDIQNLMYEIEEIEYRLDNDIKNDNGYLSNQIYMLTNSKIEKNSLENSNSTINKEEYQNKLNELNRVVEELEYVIDNKIKMNDYSSFRYVLQKFSDNYNFLIVIIFVFFAASIVSLEFNKGTIKSLLIRPYSRTKILISKYITSLIILFGAIIGVYLVQMIFGLIFLNINSLSYPIFIFNQSINEVQEINIIVYSILQIITNIPMFIIILTLAFSVSVITMNTSISMLFTVFVFYCYPIYNQIAYKFNEVYFAVSPTVHWNFSEYLFGNNVIYQYTNLGIGLFVCAIYIAVLLFTTCFIFKNKEIKNI